MATRNIVPRANGEGGIGTAAKHWGNGYFDNLSLGSEDVAGTLSNMDLALAESTGYGIVSGCTPSISGLTVTVAAGVAHLAGGTRKEIAQTNITLDSADPTNPRIDLVYITSAGVVAKVTGTAAATPSAPALPSGGISIAHVSVAANASTGTVVDSRDMLARWQNTGIVNVKDFGAVGDGVTDDTAAIQAAIDYAVQTRQPGVGCNIIADGKAIYKITAPIIIKNSYVSLDFQNATIKVVGAINGFEIYKNKDDFGVEGNEIYYFTLKNVRIIASDNSTLRAIYAQTCYSKYENVFVEGNSNGQTEANGFMQAGIEITNCWCTTISMCWTQFVKGVGLYLQNGCNDILLERVTATNNGAEGIKLSQGTAIVMNACEAGGQTADAGYALLITACNSVTINGIYCEGNDKSIKLTGGTRACELQNMWITDANNIGVRTETAANIVMSGYIREIKSGAIGISCNDSTDIDISNVINVINNGTFASGLENVVGYSTYSDKFLARATGRIGVLSLHSKWYYVDIPANGSFTIKFKAGDLLPVAVKFRAIYTSADVPARTVYAEKVATMVIYTPNQLESFSVNDILVTNSNWAVINSAGASINSNVVTWTFTNTSSTKVTGCFACETLGSKISDISINV